MSHGLTSVVAASSLVSNGSTGELIVLDHVTRARRGRHRAAPPAVRVLIADGQGLVRAGLRVLLEGGARIAVLGEATTGDEVVELARSLRPDVVLVDVSLPGLDCVEATRRMLIDSGVAVLVLTPTESDERGLDALWAGASGLLLKDTDPSELVRAVQVLAHGEALLSPSLTRRFIAELRAQPKPAGPTQERLAELTAREREVMALVALGLSNDEIAERLVVSPATARTHVSRAMVKLRARDRAQLVVFAYETRLALPRTTPRAPQREALSLAT